MPMARRRGAFAALQPASVTNVSIGSDSAGPTGQDPCQSASRKLPKLLGSRELLGRAPELSFPEVSNRVETW